MEEGKGGAVVGAGGWGISTPLLHVVGRVSTAHFHPAPHAGACRGREAASRPGGAAGGGRLCGHQRALSAGLDG